MPAAEYTPGLAKHFVTSPVACAAAGPQLHCSSNPPGIIPPPPPASPLTCTAAHAARIWTVRVAQTGPDHSAPATAIQPLRSTDLTSTGCRGEGTRQGTEAGHLQQQQQQQQ
jgi:hypothetical protein